jgi:hypothetical protein
MNNFDSDMSDNTNTAVFFDEKGGNYCLCLRARQHTIYVNTSWLFYLLPCQILAD